MTRFSQVTRRPAAEEPGAVCPAHPVLFRLRAPHHRLRLHDGFPHGALRLSRGGRQPQADDHDLRAGCPGLRRIHHLRLRPVLPPQVPGCGHPAGPGCLQGPAAPGAGGGAGSDVPVRLCPGALLGTPLAWFIWQGFRLLLVDSEEMALAFDPHAYLLALAFSLFVVVMLFVMLGRFLRRTNILDVVNESRKSEPIRAVPRWYGPLGIILLAAGGFLGYMAPKFFILVLHWYAPDALTALFYLPALARPLHAPPPHGSQRLAAGQQPATGT